MRGETSARIPAMRPKTPFLHLKADPPMKLFKTALLLSIPLSSLSACDDGGSDAEATSSGSTTETTQTSTPSTTGDDSQGDTASTTTPTSASTTTATTAAATSTTADEGSSGGTDGDTTETSDEGTDTGSSGSDSSGSSGGGDTAEVAWTGMDITPGCFLFNDPDILGTVAQWQEADGAATLTFEGSEIQYTGSLEAEPIEIGAATAGDFAGDTWVFTESFVGAIEDGHFIGTWSYSECNETQAPETCPADGGCLGTASFDITLP